MYDSIIAAKYLLALAHQKGKILNVTKVQKLLFMAYGYFLSEKRKTILNETPKAWPYGPVFPNTRSYITYTDLITIDLPEFSDIKKDTEVTTFFNLLIDKYSKYSASQLSEWSHLKGGPWDITTKQKGFKWNNPISNELISNYFSEINF